MILDSAASFLGRVLGSQPGTIKVPLKQAPQLLLFSANTQDSLRRQVSNYQRFLREHSGQLSDLSYTLSQRREHLPHRAFSIAEDGSIASVSSSTKVSGSLPQLVMIFSGQGAQWPEMGRELMETDPRFQEDILAMSSILQHLTLAPDWTIESKQQVVLLSAANTFITFCR